MSADHGQHYTDATDTRALSFVISAINDVIIQGGSGVTPQADVPLTSEPA